MRTVTGIRRQIVRLERDLDKVGVDAGKQYIRGAIAALEWALEMPDQRAPATIARLRHDYLEDLEPFTMER
jgi:hypothetical protein